METVGTLATIAQIAAALFSLGLVVATIGLWRSTSIYAKATKCYTKTQQWHFAHNIVHEVLIPDKEGRKREVEFLRALFDVDDLKKLNEFQKKEWDEFKKNLRKAEGVLAKGILDDIFSEK